MPAGRRLTETVGTGFELARGSRALLFCFGSQAVNAGAWYLGFTFSVALMLSQGIASGQTGLGSFGTAALFYGIGNVVASLVAGAREINRPLRFVVLGRCIGGLGYVLMAIDLSFAWLCACALIAAAGTPPADLAFIRLIQHHYRPSEITALYRLKMISEFAGMLVAITIAATLIGLLTVNGTIAACGVVLLLSALVGAVLLASERVKSRSQGGDAARRPAEFTTIETTS